MHCTTLSSCINSFVLYFIIIIIIIIIIISPPLTHTHTSHARKCSITHGSVATKASNRKKMVNECVKVIEAPDRKMDIIMHDVTMNV